MNQSLPKVAVLILNWNGADMLREFLPQVIENTNAELARVVVVDNGSTDSSRQVLAEEFPQVETLLLDKNYGFAEGYNLAVKHYADYKYTILLNSDAAPHKYWIEPLVSFMDSHPEAGGCQPKLLSYTDKSKFEYAGACGGFIDRNGYPYCRGRIFDTCETDNGQYDSITEVDWATGAALMVRPKIYLEVGGLDPKFFAHMEEIDLCWRMSIAGHKLYAVPQSVVYHLGGGSLPAENPRKTYLNFRNNLLMLYKNLPASSRTSTLLIRRLLDTVAWCKYLANLKWSHASAILQAHNDFRKMKREMTLSNATENPLANRPNILLSYFLQNKKTYNLL